VEADTDEDNGVTEEALGTTTFLTIPALIRLLHAPEFAVDMVRVQERERVTITNTNNATTTERAREAVRRKRKRREQQELQRLATLYNANAATPGNAVQR
jgi:hypothetical protein